MQLTLLILLLVAVLGISFLCSITEAVLLSLNPLELRLQHSRGAAFAGSWLHLKNQIERPIAALLVFNCGANTGLATLAGALFAELYGPEWLWAFSVIFTVAILFGSEMAPKVIGVHHAHRLAAPLLHPLQWMLKLSHPVVILMEKFCSKLKPRTTHPKKHSDPILDIITLVEAARAEQAIHSREEIIILHAATLSARRIRQTMVPAQAVKTFDSRKSLYENVRDQSAKLHRSYPVSLDGSLSQVIGYVRVRDLFVGDIIEHGNGRADWSKFIRPALEIDDQSSLTQLLAKFLEHREISALVKKDGVPVGWITLDDVTETLMGARG
jgi:CBS domain containing-hemolysin-like protein